MEEKGKIAAGIVTFNPDLQRLEKNIGLLLENERMATVYLADNHSANVEEICALCGRMGHTRVLRLGSNMGVATALNHLCRRAAADGAEWLLTLDQDSQPDAHLADLLAEHIPDPANRVAILCPRIEDVNMGRMYSPKTQGSEEVEKCITAGSLLSLEAWRQAGDFADELFIDGVDFEYCLRLGREGFKIRRIYSACLYQEIGKGKAINIGSHRLAIMNHPPERIYYIARNYLAIGKRYGQQAYWAGEVWKRLAIVLLFEGSKLRKLSLFLKGIRDFKRNKMGRLASTKTSK